MQRLHALDITTGAEKFGGPVVITATVPGVGDGSSGGKVTFNPLTQFQRSSLLLLNGIVYIAFASHGDNGAYHGWLLGYNAQTLQQVSVFNSTPDNGEGGIWMGGDGPAADSSGNIYLSTGNGTFSASTGGTGYGDTVIKLATANGLKVSDYFTPDDQSYLNTVDADLGSGGVLLLPDQPGPLSSTSPLPRVRKERSI